MARKVKLAIFDNDLRIEQKEYEVSKDGTKISVVSGGEAHWMPSFDNHSFLEFPYRAISSPWKISWRRVYFVKKKGSKCVNFQTDPITVSGPDPEQLKEAVGATLLGKLGIDAPEIPIWIFYIILLLVLGIAGKIFGVI